MPNNISVLIPTLNEEKNLEACLRAVSWSDDIVVFDSFSSDRTVEIARDWGARVYQRAFDNEHAHRTASLALPFKNKWLFNPDADEIATPELTSEMIGAVANCPADVAAFRMRRKDMFMGKWIRHSSLYPTWFARLFIPCSVRFERSINLNYVISGGEEKLENHLLHYSFNKGLDEWVAKHNRYSRAEAAESLMMQDRAGHWTLLFAADPVVRRKALKDLSTKMPARPLLRFAYMYFYRRGILDGAAGFHFCCLLSFYEYLISLKTKELTTLSPPISRAEISRSHVVGK